MNDDPPDLAQLIDALLRDIERQAVVAERSQLESTVAPVLAELERLAANP